MEENFAKKIKEVLGGERVSYCYQCGTCTASCPSARFTKVYNPRQFILKALLNMKEKVLTDENLWKCTTCHTCGEECPQEVHVDAALTVLRTIAVKEGFCPEPFLQLAKYVAETGRTVQVGEGVNFLREKVGLTPLENADASDYLKIMKKTGLYDTIDRRLKK